MEDDGLQRFKALMPELSLEKTLIWIHFWGRIGLDIGDGFKKRFGERVRVGMN